MSAGAGELRIPVVWSPDCLLHEPGGEVWLGVREAGYRAAGELIGMLGPVAAIQEGGYHLPSLGRYVLATLAGLQSGRAAAGRRTHPMAGSTPRALGSSVRGGG